MSRGRDTTDNPAKARSKAMPTLAILFQCLRWMSPPFGQSSTIILVTAQGTTDA